MEDRAKKCLFVCNTMGQISEIWMWRQLVGLERVDASLLTWKYISQEQCPLDGISTNILKYDPMPANKKKCYGYRLRCLPQMNFYSTIGKEKKEIEQWVLEIKPDVILAQFGFMALRILPVAKKYKIPLVAHFHGLDVSSSLNNRWYRWSLLMYLHKFSAVVVVGSHQKQWMMEHGVPKEKVHLIPCGIPTDYFLPKRQYDQNGFVRFIAVSRLVEKKGLDYTIRAFAIVKNKYPKVKFDIYGDGPLKNDLMELADELQLSGDLRFMGMVSPLVVRNEMAQSDIFLQHSIVASNGDMEGFGVSVAEASASGLPAVCSNATGIIDQVIDSKTGFLVEQKDYEAMAERMLQLVRNIELRRKMGEAGRERMKKHFDTKKQIAELEEVLLNCTEYE